MHSNLGRTVFIALLAAGLFGLFLLVTPKLTTAGSGSGGSTSTAATSDTLPDATTTSLCPCLPTSTTTTVPTPSTTVPVTTTLPLGWDPDSQTAANGYDGSVIMATSFVSPRGSSVEAGDTVAWQIRVTNDTTGDLWGVFAYVEGFGPAVCDHRHIGAGESTDCRATGLAYVGTGDVVTWVNAWTEERQVKDIVRISFSVSP